MAFKMNQLIQLSKHYIFIALCLVVFSRCSQGGTGAGDSVSDIENDSPEKSENYQSEKMDDLSDISDLKLRAFIENFNLTDLPMNIHEQSFDTTKVIPEELVQKYIFGDPSYGFFYGDRYLVDSSLYALIYHSEYRTGGKRHWARSNLLLITNQGENKGEVPEVYYQEEGTYSFNGKFYQSDNSTSISSRTEIRQTHGRKIGQYQDEKWTNYEFVTLEKLFVLNGEPNKKEEEVIDHQTDEVNPEARKAIASQLGTLLGQRFLGVSKEGDSYYRFKDSCMESGYMFEFLSTTKGSQFDGYLNDRYSPVLGIHIGEPFPYLISEVTHTGSEVTLKVKMLEHVSEITGAFDLTMDPIEYTLSKTDQGDWLLVDNINDLVTYYLPEDSAAKLPESETCTSQ